MTEKCRQCGNHMTSDEGALNRKLLYRTCPREEFLCPECLGKKLGVTSSQLREMIMVYRKQGCMLFSPLTGEK